MLKYQILSSRQYLQRLNISPITILSSRSPRNQERGDLRLLPGAVSGHHLHHQDQAEDAVLLHQPDCAVPADRLHGGAGLHAAPGLGGEVVTG